jgi:hypothetical protein
MEPGVTRIERIQEIYLIKLVLERGRLRPRAHGGESPPLHSFTCEANAVNSSTIDHPCLSDKSVVSSPEFRFIAGLMVNPSADLEPIVALNRHVRRRRTNARKKV